jgi:hypothetical protein
VKWSWLTKRQWRLTWERAAEAIRECGILWLVFSILDKIIDGTITFPWLLTNFGISIVLWSYGMYIEIRTVTNSE